MNLKVPLLPSVATIGNFDGLHLGHRQMIEELVEKAQSLSLIPTVITFEPLPHTFLYPEKPYFRLMSFREKLKLLREWGVQQVICLRFNKTLSQLYPDAFIETYIMPYNIKYLILGEDFRFGVNRQGHILWLQENAKQFGFSVEKMPLFKKEEQKISSTLIREIFIQGDCQKANELLGRNFSLEGRVIKGAQMGRLFGIPTANIRVNQLKQFNQLFKGVFVGQVEIEKKYYKAAINIGTRPTVQGKDFIAEAHILDFSQDIYGKRIRMEFLHKIREECRFDSIEKLKNQIAKDLLFVKQWVVQ